MRYESQRKWEEDNREQRLAYFRDYYRRVKDEKRAAFNSRQRAYYESHRDEYRVRGAKWRERHRDAIKVSRQLGVSMQVARDLLAAIPKREAHERRDS